MDIRLRFPAKHPFLLDDAWPLEAYGAVAEFEREGDEVTALLLTFRNQPLDMAPRVTSPTNGPVRAHIEIPAGVEGSARGIVRRFANYINLFVSIEFELDATEVEYLPSDDLEKDHLDLY